MLLDFFSKTDMLMKYVIIAFFGKYDFQTIPQNQEFYYKCKQLFQWNFFIIQYSKQQIFFWN